MTQPKERPILFSGPMVRAILDGRKTQTRRIVKHKENRWECGDDGVTGEFWPYWPCYVYGEPEPVVMPCPYGEPGDRLWVRESFLPCRSLGDLCKINEASYVCFRDGSQAFKSGEVCPWMSEKPLVWPKDHKFRPSIHMPRWASRITLEITGVRVERLQDISEADAMAEGCERIDLSPREIDGVQVHPLTSTYFAAFAELWRSINGPESWDANPWVWVVEFSKVDALTDGGDE